MPVRQPMTPASADNSNRPERPVRVRTRAVDAEDREQRRTMILDAAERLFATSPNRDISMAEVAARAGLAKGTVYLYFESKEVLLLSLHERRVEAFFSELIGMLRHAPVFGFAEMAGVVRRHLTEEPLYMALGSVAMGFMDQQVVPETLQKLSDRISGWLIEAGRELERRLAVQPAGEGVRMLIHGYALIVGLWHLIAVPCAASSAAEHAMGGLNYADEAELALGRYWSSVLDTAAVAPARAAHVTPLQDPGGSPVKTAGRSRRNRSA